ncbi:MAG: SixA phosphatase family protein [Steroidobacterales bacterium]
MRHAHAEPAQPPLPEAERPLSARGRKQAASSAARLAAADCVPELLLVSPALRTRATAAIVVQALSLQKSCVRYEPELYLAPPATLLAVIRRCPPTVNTLLILGHNPGLSELAHRFDAERTAIDLPTAAVCCLELPGDHWAQLTPHAAPWKLLS